MPIDQTIPELQKRYRLDSETGKIFWKISYPNTSVKAGQPAGHYKGTQFCVTCKGQDFPARRVAWLLHYGVWPTGHIWLRDSDPENLRPANMVLRRDLSREQNRRVCGFCEKSFTVPHAKVPGKFCSHDCRRADTERRRAARVERTCRICGQTQELAAFSSKYNVCRCCHPAFARQQYLAKKYNMRVEDVRRLLERQSYLCAICLTAPDTGPQIDHDHATGAVRGILCSSCNTGLGHFRDSTALLASAMAYLSSPPA